MIKVIWTNKAHHQLKKLPSPEAAEIVSRAEDLWKWPHVVGVVKIVSRDYEYRLKIGRYRLIFSVETFERITLLSIEEVVKRNERTY